MIRTLALVFGIALASVGATAAAAAEPPVTTRTIAVQRGVFDTVGRATDLSTLCDGRAPRTVELTRTPADLAATVLSGMWYTPAHLKITCDTP